METLNIGIELDQGVDFNAVIGISGDNGPIDITGYQFKSEMRADTNPLSPVIAEFVFTILNQQYNTGQVMWSLPAASSVEGEFEMSVATPLSKLRQTTRFVFDVQMLDTSGKSSRIIQGIIYVSPRATQESA